MTEKLAQRIIILVDISDLAPRAAINSLHHGFEITGLLTTAGIKMSDK